MISMIPCYKTKETFSLIETQDQNFLIHYGMYL